MRHFAFIPCLASSLVTNLPVESLQSLNSAGASTRVQKLRSAPGASVDEPSNRRSALLSIFGGAAATFMAPVGARALDMDAFVNSQVRSCMLSMRDFGIPLPRTSSRATLTNVYTIYHALLSTARPRYQELRPQEGSKVHPAPNIGPSPLQVRPEWKRSRRSLRPSQGCRWLPSQAWLGG
jgi:hypothetical protein